VVSLTIPVHRAERQPKQAPRRQVVVWGAGIWLGRDS